MAEVPVVLTDKQKKSLAKIERKEQNLERIKLANAQLYQEQAADINLTPTPPERKPACAPTDNNRPYLPVGDSNRSWGGQKTRKNLLARQTDLVQTNLTIY